MNTATATLVHTSSMSADNALRIARVAAAGRVQDDRRRADKRRAREHAAWLRDAATGSTEEWCYICSRPTDHRGEHDNAQIAAYAARRPVLVTVG